MTIIDKRKAKAVKFRDVPPAATFFFVDTDTWGKVLHMRTITCIITENESYNAVDLEDGYLICVGDEELVTLCDAEVIIK